MIPCCNLNDNLGLPLEVCVCGEGRGGGRCGHIPEKSGSCVTVLVVVLHPRWSSLPGGRVDPTDDTILRAALREAKEQV